MQLIADQLSRSFGARRIFGPFSFAVGPGEVLGVAGANGSGKTTLLRTIVGLLRPSSGSVRVGSNGSLVGPRERPHAFGWAAPDLSLYAELTAAENLMFFARVAGRPLSAARVDELLLALGLVPQRISTTPIRYLSTGQRQRLKLGFATSREPAFLILDEPGSNLDEPGRGVIEKLVAAQRARGGTVIASNDSRDLSLADRVLTLS
ncbi:MAG: ABC transporter ATP-binding protein [Thermoanaerobaculia bacterium]